MKPDETRLLQELQKRTKAGFFCVSDVIDELGINPKRAMYLLKKWTEKGWYNYGTSLTSGWLTQEGERQTGP